MVRKCRGDWLSAFVDYASSGEAPKRMYYWCGVSALAGALRRKVWIDQVYFQWYPNLYIVLVAPAGIVAKSTTSDVAMSLLREVPGIKFGPSVVTWPALVTAFAESGEEFYLRGDSLIDGGELHKMAAMTIVSSEFGNLLNPKDREMVDMLVNLWDGRPFTKVTKMSGTDEVINPWINLIACTTPDWIAGSFPEYMIGGGFTSRCIWIFADEKDKYIAYPADAIPPNFHRLRANLVEDLTWISTKLKGEYRLDNEAKEFGTYWYKRHYQEDSLALDSTRFGGYIARKQTQAHKLAMVIAASKRDDLVIQRADLEEAIVKLTELEPDMHMVFEKIGMKEGALHIERIAAEIKRRGRVPVQEVWDKLRKYFPMHNEIEAVIASAERAGLMHLRSENGSAHYYPNGRETPKLSVVPTEGAVATINPVRS